MKAPRTLLRRQIVLITLLVISIVLALIAFNLSQLIGLTLERAGGTAESAALQMAASANSAILTAPQDAPLTAISTSQAVRQTAARLLQQNPGVKSIAILDSSGTIVFEWSPSGDSNSPSVELNHLETSSFLKQLRWIISGGPGIAFYDRSLAFRDSMLGSIRVNVSLDQQRKQVLDAAGINLLMALAGIALALFVAILSTRLLNTPLKLITSSIQQLELPGATPVEADLGKEPINQIDALADRIQLISRQVAGDRSELVEARERLQQIVSNLQERILLVNAEGSIMLASPEIGEILGCESGIEGKQIEVAIGSDHPLVILVRLAIASGEPSTTVTLPAMHDNRGKQASANVQLIFDEGRVAGALVSLRDRETVAQLESQLSYSERLAELARITSGVAHEVKNPLNAMVIHLELLREKLIRPGPSDPEVLPQLDILGSEISRLDRVVQTFLTFNKPPKVQFRPLSVNQLLTETVTLAAPEATKRDAVIEQHFQADLPRINGDPDLLKQAFINIVMNGIESLNGAGRLTISTQLTNGRLLISIADNGVGIDPSSTHRVFQLYYTTKEQGSGIGLAQAYRAVQLHNGNLTFDSSLGLGTTFYIRLPLG
jgi:signal transduction histidine kinase